MRRDAVIITSTVILIAALFFSMKKEADSVKFTSEIQDNINKALATDSLFVHEWNGDLDSEGNEKRLSEMPFGVEIYKKNVLVWWNEAARLIPRYKEAQYIVEKKGQMDIVIRTELNSWKGIVFLPVLPGQAGQKNDKQVVIRGVDYEVEAPPSWHVCVRIWFIAFILLGSIYWIVRRIFPLRAKQQNFLPAFLLVGTFRLLLSLPVVHQVLEPLFLFRASSDSILLVSPATLFMDTFMLWMTVYFLQSSKGIAFFRDWPSSIYHTVISFLLGILFIYWLSLMKDMVYDELFYINVSEFLVSNPSGLWVTFILILNLLAGFLILHAILSRARPAKARGYQRYIYLLMGLAATGPVIYMMDLAVNPILFYLFLISVVLIFDVYAEIKDQKLTYVLWWMLLFSGFLAAGFFHFDQLKSRENRENFIQQHFYSASAAEIETAKSIKQNLDTSDIFLKLGQLEYPAKWDKEEIRGLFSGLLSVPVSDFDIELFDQNGFSLFSNHFGNYHRVKKSLQISEMVAGNNLVFHPLDNQYYLKYEISPNHHPNGPWLFVLSFPRTEAADKITGNMSYALIKNGFIVEKNIHSVDTPADRELIQVSQSGLQDNFLYTVRENNMGYKMLVFEPNPGLLKPISIFSFLFALTGAFLFLLAWLNTRKVFLPDVLPLKIGEKSSLKTKIQLSIILLIIFSFIIVGSVTAFYFYNLIQANQSGKEREETQILANSVIQESRDKESQEELVGYFYKNLLNLSYVHGKNLQLYDFQGKLLATSIHDPSEYIIPYHQVNHGQQTKIKFKTKEENNHFDYIPLIDNGGNRAGYLGIQHQYTDISSRSIIDFLGTILNVYIFLFLIAGVIAITIANSITQPIAILAEKLKQFKLGKTNEFLEWKSNDEIGTLITEYNNLNEALTRSAQMLAKTERDMAWREMAKQVAHEIKNPLTPMKLSIQYLEKAAKDDPERAKEMIPRVSSTLIEQIDNLSQIAVEFSNFAAMPQANNEKVTLNDLVVMIHDLFRKRDDMDITLSTPIDDLVVFADKNHLVRILNNLVKNAIQAIPDDRRGKIDISLYQENQNAVVRVTDNGSGIAENMKSKVFAPNFTTKSSGTGLGLAISANMIESFNGKIYFESDTDMGTRFYISIPLMKKEESRQDMRVNLDE